MRHGQTDDDDPLSAFRSEEEVARPRPFGGLRTVPATLSGGEPEIPGAYDPRLILISAAVLGVLVLSLVVLGPATPAPETPVPTGTLEARALVAPTGFTVVPVRRGAFDVSAPGSEARPAQPMSATVSLASIRPVPADPVADFERPRETTSFIPDAGPSVAYAVTSEPAENDRAVTNAALEADTPVAPPSPAANVLNASATTTATAAIHRTLDQYRQSYNTLDAAAVSMIWVGLDTRALQRAFSSLSRQDLDFDRCEVSLAAGATRATAECAGALNYVRKVGSGESHQRKMAWTIDFVRAGDRWMIERVAAR